MLIDPMFNPRQHKNPNTYDVDICGSTCQVLIVDNCHVSGNSITWQPGHSAMRISYIKNEYHRITMATISGPTDKVILGSDIIEAIKPKLLAAMWDKPFEVLVVVR